MTHMIHAPMLSEAEGIHHGFFTTEGGVSEGIYASLQCGRGAVDDPRENVAENRARAAKALKVAKEKLLSCYQHHSADVVTVGTPWRPGKPPKADAMVCKTPGIALGILTADCAPVLFVDAKAGIIGAAHAGWKGAIGGVLEATVEAMIQLGAERQRVQAAIGPCISQENYQVDDAYRERFRDLDSGNSRFFRPDPSEEGKFRFDLPGYCAARLTACGVKDAELPKHCTYGDARMFFSNRRALHKGEGDYGRGLSAIVLR